MNICYNRLVLKHLFLIHLQMKLEKFIAVEIEPDGIP